jgi:hypothetical protein
MLRSTSVCTLAALSQSVCLELTSWAVATNMSTFERKSTWKRYRAYQIGETEVPDSELGITFLIVPSSLQRSLGPDRVVSINLLKTIWEHPAPYTLNPKLRP